MTKSAEGREPLSLGAILRGDYLTTAGLVLVGMVALLFFAVEILPAGLNGQPIQPPVEELVLLAGMILLFAAGLAWRILALRDVWQGGARVPGQVQQALFLGSGGRVTVRYAYQGQDYLRRVRVFNDARGVRARIFHAGAQVGVVIDPADPRRMLLEDLFV